LESRIPNPQSPTPNPQPLIPVLNAILDADVAARAGWLLLDLAHAFLNGGARFLQVRAKQASSAWLLDTSSAIVALARTAGAVVVVNDRPDVARLSHADGVHLGQEDLAPDAARGIVGRESMIGLSTHTLEQVDAAVGQPVSYLAIGPVFGTATKATGHPAIGLGLVGRAAARARARGLPLVAIGGITLETAAGVMRAGASSVAVISDLVATPDPEARVRAYLERLSQVSDV
jgi:thiamine-phosphate pyrophosphorylase